MEEGNDTMCIVMNCKNESLNPCNMCEVHMQELLLKMSKERIKNKGKTSKKNKDCQNKDGKTSKKIKDGPKNKTAYIFFCEETRPHLKTNNPLLTPQQIISEMGRLWKLAKQNDEIQKYIELADAYKESKHSDKEELSKNSDSD